MNLLLLLAWAAPILASFQCGIPAMHRQQRAIIGGNNVTTAGKWPWQVGLWKDEDHASGFHGIACGGTIIGKEWILTAAHCIVPPAGKITIFGGITSKDDAVSPHGKIVKSQVIEEIPHPGYIDGIFSDDIALLKLETPIDFDDIVSSICLPSHSQPIPSNVTAVATGFGRTNITDSNGNNEFIFDDQLRETRVPMVPTDVCREKMSKAENSDLIKWDNLICAGSFGHGTLKGDSGGPLMMKDSDGRWHQIGVTSFSVQTMELDRLPGAYTDVRKYCDWIKEATKGDVNCQDEPVTLEDPAIHN